MSDWLLKKSNRKLFKLLGQKGLLPPILDKNLEHSTSKVIKIESNISYLDYTRLFNQLQSELEAIKHNTRILVLNYANEAVLYGLLKGVVKSLSKEIGKKGITINQLKVNQEQDLKTAIQFFTSNASAFITGQNFDISQCNLIDNNSNSNKKVLVTGAAQGIGEATAIALSRKGFLPILLDLPQQKNKLKTLSEELNGSYILCNLLEQNAIQKVIKTLNNEPIYGLVNNAGITRDKSFKRLSKEHWNQVLQLNLQVPIELTNQLLEKNLIESSGKIINVSSIGGIAGNAGQTNYAGAKSALISFTTSFSHESITMNAVAPGFIETKMTEKLPFMVKEGGRRLAALKQGGQPEDIANAITFLCQENTLFQNQLVRVCGGHLMGE